jgi:hypothetical protein
MRKSRFFRFLITVIPIITLLLIQLPMLTPIKAITGFTVTYDGNGHTAGDVPIDSTLYPEGDEVSIADNTGNLEKDGLVFVGWTLLVDDSDVLKPGDTLIMESSDLVLYAKWEPALIVNYDFDNQLIDQLGNSVLIPFSTENDGYNHNNATSGFGNDDDGSFWYWTSTLARGGGFKIDIDQAISTSYTIGVRFSFTSTGSGYRKIIDYKNSASDTGFYFLGGRLNFYPYGTGTTNVANDQVVDIIATRKSDGLFTAYFVINGTLYKELELNAGSEAIPSIVDGKVRFGFFFDDNATSSEATSGGKVYSVRVWNGPISSVQAETAMESTYTVTFDTDSDTMIATQTIKEGDKATQPADPQKVGHTFAGWYHHVGQGWMEYDFDAPVTENLELRALWDINQYEVRFLDFDDTLLQASMVDHGSDAVSPVHPSREDWEFMGWDSSLTNITSARTIRAIYKSIIQTTIVDDGLEDLAIESSNLDQAVAFSEEDLDEPAKIRLNVVRLTLQELNQTETDLLNDYSESLGTDLTFEYLLLDISLFKEVGEEISAIEQTLEPITISFKVPDMFKGKDFKLIRIHHGILEVLDFQLDDDTDFITFETDRFSTYALVLGEQDPLPDTSDQNSIGWSLLLLGIILLVLSSREAIGTKQ